MKKINLVRTVLTFAFLLLIHSVGSGQQLSESVQNTGAEEPCSS